MTIFQNAPTSVQNTKFRGGQGKFAAPRPHGHSHQGVDIVSTVSSNDRTTYSVKAVAAGDIAYCTSNLPGYGYTVIVDHGDNTYTLYAHLATNASQGMVSLGQSVTAGFVLGYMADLANQETSSGNAADVDDQVERIMLHFEHFSAQSGRSSSGSIGNDIKAGGVLIDPTGDLAAFGYPN